jgi:hypothetical protein
MCAAFGFFSITGKGLFLSCISAAFLIFLAAAAGAGIIAANFGFTANHRLFGWITGIYEVPLSVLLSEFTQFLVVLKTFVSLKLGFERNRANLIIYATLFGLQYFQAPPFGRLGPFSVGLHVGLVACLGSMRLLDKVHFDLSVGGIPCPHELLGRLGLFDSGEQWLTTLLKGFSTFTRTLHKHSY